MTSRIEIELTSKRDDATWTWRAAGAREPKGTLEGKILPDDASVGTVYRAEADFTIDGIDILTVASPTRERRSGLETLELLGSSDDEPLVTSTLAKGGRGGEGRGRRDDRGGRSDRGPKGKRPDQDGKRGERKGREPRRNDRPEVPPPPERPKAPRLDAKRTHRKVFLDGLPAEQRPVAEQALKGGVPAVRKALEQQNEQLRAEKKPTIASDALVELAESLLPGLRSAEWRDKAEAAIEQLDEVDLRDLRSVVTAADKGARDDHTRALAAQLREGLNARLDREVQLWIEDLADSVEHTRAVRGLRISSRPPKAGTPVPAELTEGLVKMTNESLTAEVSADRWIRILDALAFSPIRSLVVPASLPTKPARELTEAISRMGTRLPQIAQIFGIDPETKAQRRKRRESEKQQRRNRPRNNKSGGDKSEAKAPGQPKAVEGDKSDNSGDASEPETPAPQPEAAPVDDASTDTVEASNEAPVRASADQ